MTNPLMNPLMNPQYMQMMMSQMAMNPMSMMNPHNGRTHKPMHRPMHKQHRPLPKSWTTDQLKQKLTEFMAYDQEKKVHLPTLNNLKEINPRRNAFPQNQSSPQKLR